MNILITICARGGSKGIPGKNIKTIGGQPLIAYTIGHAKAFAKTHHADIGLSTDSEAIKQVAAQYGIETAYLRPEILATDGAGKIPVLDHLLRYEENINQKKYDLILDLDITSPLRTQDDLNSAFTQLINHNEALNLISVSPANRNPYFNMLEQNQEGYYELCKKGSFLSRQTAPKVYDMNASFYFYKRTFFDLGFAGAVTNKTLIYEMDHICFDLDHPIDFEFLSYLLNENKIGFQI